MKIVEFNKVKEGNPELAAELRELAAKVESGEVNDLIWAFIEDGEFETCRFASLADALVLITLLHSQILDNFRSHS